MSGVFGAVQSIAYAFVCVAAAGFVTRAHNGLIWAVLGLSGFAVSLSLVPIFRSAVLCGMAMGVAFMALGLVWPALHSWVGAEPDPKLRTKYMSWFNLSWSFGFTLSPLVTGPLYDYDYRLPFILFFVLCIGCIAVVRSLPHERDYFGVATQEMMEAREEHDRASEAYLWCAWCATFVVNALVGVTRCVYPKRVDDLVASGELRLLFEQVPADFLTRAPATKFSWLAGALALATAIMFIVLGRTSFWRHRFIVLAAFQAASGAAFWILGTTHSLVVMAVCFIITGATMGIAFFSSAYYSLANPEHKHRRASMNEAFVGLGGFAGSLLFGYMVGWYGMALPFHITPILVGGAIVLQWMLLRLK